VAGNALADDLVQGEPGGKHYDRRHPMGHFGRMTFGVVVGVALLGGFGAAVPATALAAAAPAPAATAIEYGLASPAATAIEYGLASHVSICNPTAVEYGGIVGCG
jgi:hypothetical protein